MTDEQLRIDRLGLAVGKCTIRADQPSAIDLVYVMDILPGGGRGMRHIAFHSDGPDVSFPGCYRLSQIHGPAVIDLEVTLAGTHAYMLSITVNGRRACLGYGLPDPENPLSLMVSWWTGAVEPYGVVKYTIRDERTITGYYISKMSPDRPGADIAIGDTRRGFSGNFVLKSREVNGRTWGPHDWSLTQRGDVVDLVWRENGRAFCVGLGMVDPADRKSILVNYIAI